MPEKEKRMSRAFRKAAKEGKYDAL
jgi:hypothetical protein